MPRALGGAAVAGQTSRVCASLAEPDQPQHVRDGLYYGIAVIRSRRSLIYKHNKNIQASHSDVLLMYSDGLLELLIPTLFFPFFASYPYILYFSLWRKSERRTENMPPVCSRVVPTSLQALWALGNIIGDGVELRDYVLDHGIVPAILKYVHTLCM